jgi:hypothetical protein
VPATLASARPGSGGTSCRRLAVAGSSTVPCPAHPQTALLFLAPRPTPAPPQRNYRTFLLFIYGTTIYIMWTFGISLWSFWIKARDLKAAGKSIEILTIIAANPAGVALCVLCFIFFWFVGGLSGFHTFLVGTNQTTYENFRCDSARPALRFAAVALNPMLNPVAS